jgi:hypothetical protein
VAAASWDSSCCWYADPFPEPGPEAGAARVARASCFSKACFSAFMDFRMDSMTALAVSNSPFMLICRTSLSPSWRVRSAFSRSYAAMMSFLSESCSVRLFFSPVRASTVALSVLFSLRTSSEDFWRSARAWGRGSGASLMPSRAALSSFRCRRRRSTVATAAL